MNIYIYYNMSHFQLLRKHGDCCKYSQYFAPNTWNSLGWLTLSVIGLLPATEVPGSFARWPELTLRFILHILDTYMICRASILYLLTYDKYIYHSSCAICQCVLFDVRFFVLHPVFVLISVILFVTTLTWHVSWIQNNLYKVISRWGLKTICMSI